MTWVAAQIALEFRGSRRLVFRGAQFRVRNPRANGRTYQRHDRIPRTGTPYLSVEMELQKSRLNFYLPIRQRKARVSHKINEYWLRPVPVISGWVFIEIKTQEDLAKLQRCRAIGSIFDHTGKPLFIKDEDVQALIARYGTRNQAPIVEAFKPGDIAEFREGILEGYRGTVERASEKEVVVLLDGLRGVKATPSVLVKG